MLQCTDQLRVDAAIRYERDMNPANVARSAIPAGALDFCTPVKGEDSHMDTLHPLQITVSHTSLDTYQTCPLMYHAKYVTKEVIFSPTVHTEYGNRLHKAMENRVKDGTPLPPEFASMEEMALKVCGMKGIVMVEKQLALTEDLKATEFFASDAWIRGLADVLVFNKETGLLSVLDYKTGKPKEEMQQLEMMALAAFFRFEGVKKIKVMFIYTKTGTVDKREYSPTDIPDIAARIRHKIERLKMAHKNNLFPPQPNGLCRQWCEVKRCQFHGVGKPFGGNRANA
jgi:PD-(D/E)XK nuclease superfamily